MEKVVTRCLATLRELAGQTDPPLLPLIRYKLLTPGSSPEGKPG
jgi:hypothetical protein